LKVSVSLWILMGLVSACFIKGIVDMVSAFGRGESAQSILIGAIPMYLLGALVVFFLGTLIKQVSENERSESNQEQTAED